MKSLRVTLSNPTTNATMLVRYANTSWPDHTEWLGNRAAFRLSDGSLPTLLSSLERLEETVAHQAAQSGAAFTIDDLGGTATVWADNVK